MDKQKGLPVIVALLRKGMQDYTSTVSPLQLNVLKTLDTISNYQRPIFSLVVSQRMYKITNL